MVNILKIILNYIVNILKIILLENIPIHLENYGYIIYKYISYNIFF